MAATKFIGTARTKRRIRDAVKKLEQRAIEEHVKAARTVTNLFMGRTPVWSGESVVNYKWGVGAKPVGSTRAAVGAGPPGPTGSMALGAEPRRPANQAVVLSELASLKMKKLTTLVLTNLLPQNKWDLIDSGSAPTAGSARNPGGVSNIAVQTAKLILPFHK